MQERSERTRRRLVFAGAELFHRSGYANATLGEIAGAAGVTKGALYFHFASKDELADAVQRRGCRLLREAVRGLNESGVSPLQALIDATHWLARTLHEEPAIPASFRITKECGGHPSAQQDFQGAWLATVSDLLRMARDTGELPLGGPADEAGDGAAEGDGLSPAERWESAEALVAAAVCGIEVLSGTGLSYAELRRKVAALWGLLLPSLVGRACSGEYRTDAREAPESGGVCAYEFLGSGV
ncbi:ScbR family autoregulator-binding transcription factor [Streptomyces lavendulae]|uniref:ScbR family autoregulator-binding transcription factor n=1 Tax=Streptomyces lavendulae TaxID=1914 RepID=UPI0024A34D84|nr:ScbR family autoregulator-binding transcription factor [Streptomyces lavendulae]GLW01109.1 TetR family transcriptional regulator [Streptomyces lavendulae subsp. lavendulae]